MIIVNQYLIGNRGNKYHCFSEILHIIMTNQCKIYYHLIIYTVLLCKPFSIIAGVKTLDLWQCWWRLHWHNIHWQWFY